MKPLRTRLQEARKRLGVPWEVLERDYLLSWVLAGLGEVEPLRATLVFKGGTALKKCYFGDYRFSEDLDFSGLAGVPTGETMERTVREACRAASRLLDEYAPVEISCERYTEREPHPGGQEAFTIRARMPWQKQPQTRVMIETTVDEKVLKPAQKRKIIHEYGEPLEVEIQVYSLEEVVAEKLRAILQHVETLEKRGWGRSRARSRRCRRPRPSGRRGCSCLPARPEGLLAGREDRGLVGLLPGGIRRQLPRRGRPPGCSAVRPSCSPGNVWCRPGPGPRRPRTAMRSSGGCGWT